MQVQARLLGHGEIIVVMNGDPEHGAQEPFFIGEAAALYDTKAGEVGITYTWELGDQENLFGKMCNNDVVLDIIKYEHIGGLQRGSRCTLRAFAFAMFDWRR